MHSFAPCLNRNPANSSTTASGENVPVEDIDLGAIKADLEFLMERSRGCRHGGSRCPLKSSLTANDINERPKLNPPLSDPPYLRRMTGDRVWRQEGKDYRDLARRLREIASKCCLPNPQREFLGFAQRYQRGADQMDRNAAFIRAKFRSL
jgi:hypothetical protein